MSGAIICHSNNNSRQYFLHITPTRAIRYEDKIVEEAEGMRGRISKRSSGEGRASPRLCIFAVNASRSVPCCKRDRDSTKPALFELSFASRRSFLFVFFRMISRLLRGLYVVSRQWKRTWGHSNRLPELWTRVLRKLSAWAIVGDGKSIYKCAPNGRFSSTSQGLVFGFGFRRNDSPWITLALTLNALH